MEELTEQDFDQMYHLMQLSFIADELRPYEEQKLLFRESVYHVYAERDQADRHIKGFIAIWNFEDFVFVDYFAVNPIYRNHGLGKYILEQLRSMTDKEICLEIETPQNEISIRRLAFYERNHFKLCDFPYEQPPIARGNAPVDLSLMSTKTIDNPEHFKKLKAVIYKYAYERFN